MRHSLLSKVARTVIQPRLNSLSLHDVIFGGLSLWLVVLTTAMTGSGGQSTTSQMQSYVHIQRRNKQNPECIPHFKKNDST